MIAMRARNLYDVDELEIMEVYELFELAKIFKRRMSSPVNKLPIFKDKTVCNLFVEPSTRTKNSFELAEKFLGMNVLNFNTSSSALSKKETLKDTVLTLSSMSIDLYVIRHREPGSPAFISKFTDAQIINAGDGLHAHPTQALLDTFTIFERFGSFKDLRISIIGDYYHSRVIRSNLKLLNKLGANITVCSPSTLTPKSSSLYNMNFTNDVVEAIKGSDVVMGLRMQLERQTDGLFASLKEYNENFGITEELFEKYANKNAILMHPGPINRGVELSGSIADKHYSVINEQVKNGVATRTALIYKMMGGEGI
ncbi:MULTISPECIES: aspartate carbamoyltransferase catalytic subunit [Oceanotoga]|jgi:aspartate carbamoyltransferase catalytic subunit|uniref:Aspartate carbamoyltransferase n=1 Tax=Oceanotoga teriensis TaxID=515440 RepID=A0AA45C6Z3_9BACT|nr:MULTISPECIES: aspartate carbamoyltransferase catalytic subunit [Oceanotoga]MDN5342638.1 aspartate carbamoyltransferase catalytic subunit [Oceanotoga sp.]MDO7975961.1 aspartate carbamoyltransferase catalytic subunit [Oceanotoga teriensis]PWJ95054.1 aspartate carbamoyltransferase [Oceanotoga teriensis]